MEYEIFVNSIWMNERKMFAQKCVVFCQKVILLTLVAPYSIPALYTQPFQRKVDKLH